MWFTGAMSETPRPSEEITGMPKDLLQMREALLQRAEERLAYPEGPAAPEVAAVEKRIANDPEELATYAAELIKLRKAAAARQASFAVPFIPGAFAAIAHAVTNRKQKET